jgi:lysophospholipase L1-like esterase
MDQGARAGQEVKLRHSFALLAAAALVAAASPLGAKRVSPTDPRIQILGRVAPTSEEDVQMGFPGVTVRFAYRGPAPALLLEASSETCYFNLSCNGWDPVLLHPRKGRHEVPLTSGRAPGQGWLVELVRRTDAWQGEVAFRGLELPEGCELLPPPPLPSRRLMCIGDSITSGDKLDRTPPDEDLGPRASNAGRSYGMLLGRWLGAQVHLVSEGGRGLTRDWRGQRDVATAPQFFQRALPEDPASRWDPKAYAPDAVIVCLGTNDFNPGLPDETAFLAAYDRFLDELRAAHPKAALILAESPVFEEGPERAKRELLRRCLDALVARRRAAGDARIAVAPLRKQPGTAADLHPTAFQHEQIALELMPVVKALTGW